MSVKKIFVGFILFIGLLTILVGFGRYIHHDYITVCFPDEENKLYKELKGCSLPNPKELRTSKSCLTFKFEGESIIKNKYIIKCKGKEGITIYINLDKYPITFWSKTNY